MLRARYGTDGEGFNIKDNKFVRSIILFLRRNKTYLISGALLLVWFRQPESVEMRRMRAYSYSSQRRKKNKVSRVTNSYSCRSLPKSWNTNVWYKKNVSQCFRADLESFVWVEQLHYIKRVVNLIYNIIPSTVQIYVNRKKWEGKHSIVWNSITPIERKTEEIWLSPMAKALITTEISNGQNDNTKRHQKKFRLHSDCRPT